MEEDENYIRRTTYGTPENIRIRRFYNRLNNRPLNYGMEDLFPNVESYTSQPMTSIVPLNEPQQQISGFTPDFRLEVKLSDLQPINHPDIDWRRLGKSIYNEFDTSGKLIRLGGENNLNAISYGGYQWLNGVLGGDYLERKQNYYNQMPNENWQNAAKMIDNGLAAYAQATFPYKKLAQNTISGINRVFPYIKK